MFYDQILKNDYSVLLLPAAWYERRQMKKIYSPLLEGLLGLYLGFEWIQVLITTSC